jgi:hypothetical protein
MSTTPVESWAGVDLAQVGPIYPFFGWEVFFTLVILVAYVVWQIVQFRGENRLLSRQAAVLDQPRALERALAERRIDIGVDGNAPANARSHDSMKTKSV